MDLSVRTAEWSGVLGVCAVLSGDSCLTILDETGKRVMEFVEKDVRVFKWSTKSNLLAVGSGGCLTVFEIDKTNWSVEVVLERAVEALDLFWCGDDVIAILPSCGVEVIDVKRNAVRSFSFEFQPKFVTVTGSSGVIVVGEDGEVYKVVGSESILVTRVLSPVHVVVSNMEYTCVIYSDNLVFRFHPTNSSGDQGWMKLHDGTISHALIAGNALWYSVGNVIYGKSMSNETDVVLELKNEKSHVLSFVCDPVRDVLVSVSMRGTIAAWRTRMKGSLAKCILTTSCQKAFWHPQAEMVLLTNDMSCCIRRPPFPICSCDAVLADSRTIETRDGRHFDLEIDAIDITSSLGHTIVHFPEKVCVFDRAFELKGEVRKRVHSVGVSAATVICGCEHGIFLFDLQGQPISEHPLTNGSLSRMAVNGIFVAIFTTENHVLLFRISNNKLKCVRSFSLQDKISCCYSIGVSKDGTFLSVCTESSGQVMNMIIHAETEKSSLMVSGQLRWDMVHGSLFCVESDANLEVFAISQQLELHSVWKVPTDPTYFLQYMAIPRLVTACYGGSFESCVVSHIVSPFYELDGVNVSTKSLRIGEYLTNVFEDATFRSDDGSFAPRTTKPDHKSSHDSTTCQFDGFEWEDRHFNHEKRKEGPTTGIFLGRISEYRGDFEEALEHYRHAKADAEKVRLLCLMKRFDEVDMIMEGCDDEAVICLYAHLLTKLSKDNMSLLPKAFQLYMKATCYDTAFTLAFDNQMTEQLVSIAGLVTRQLVLKAAKAFENDPTTSSALYLHAGMADKALSIAISADNLTAFNYVLDNCCVRIGATIANECIGVCESRQDFARQAKIMVLSGRYRDAAEVCEKNAVILLRDMLLQVVDNPTPDGAALLHQQCAYHMAAKVYQSLGLAAQEMNELIMTGNLKLVIECAYRNDTAAVYQVAAKYLASTWPTLGSSAFNTVIEFYCKSECFDELFDFLDALALKEIHKNGNYYKATKILAKLRELVAMHASGEYYERIMKKTSERIRFIEMYNEAEIANPERLMSLCNSLLMTKSAAETVNMSDVRMMVAREMLAREDYTSARKLLDEILECGVDLKRYMDLETIRRIFRKTGEPYFECTDDDLSDVVDDLPHFVTFD